MKKNILKIYYKGLLYSLRRAFENAIFKIIQVIFKQYYYFMNYVNHNEVKIQKLHF